LIAGDGDAVTGAASAGGGTLAGVSGAAVAVVLMDLCPLCLLDVEMFGFVEVCRWIQVARSRLVSKGST